MFLERLFRDEKDREFSALQEYKFVVQKTLCLNMQNKGKERGTTIDTAPYNIFFKSFCSRSNLFNENLFLVTSVCKHNVHPIVNKMN